MTCVIGRQGNEKMIRNWYVFRKYFWENISSSSLNASYFRLIALSAASCVVTLSLSLWAGSDQYTTLSTAGCVALVAATAWTWSEKINVGTYVIRTSGPGVRVCIGMFQLKFIYRTRKICAEVKWGWNNNIWVSEWQSTCSSLIFLSVLLYNNTKKYYFSSIFLCLDS